MDSPSTDTGAVWNAALIRAALISLIVGALTVLTTRQLNIDIGPLTAHPSWEDCFIAGGVAFLSALLTRGFGEGIYDANRAVKGDMNAGDVPVASAKATVIET